VGFARGLYERFRVLIHEAAKFGVVGAIGFVVSLGGADLLHFSLGVGKYTSVVIATVLATIVTFIGNRWWAFRHRERTGMGKETVLFFVFNGIGLLIQLACVAIVVDGFNLQGSKLWYNLANLTGIALGTLFRFWSYRKWVWKEGGPEAAGFPADAELPTPPDYPDQPEANGNGARPGSPLPHREPRDMSTPRAGR
jgi:putative flippase GtrA